MRKPFHALAAAVLALSIAAGGCAKDKSPAQLQSAKEIAGTGKKAATKPRAKLFTGTIEELDEAAGTVTLKGPKGEMTFQARAKAKEQLDGLEIGDKIIVKHDGKIVLSIVKPRTSKCVLASKPNELL